MGKLIRTYCSNNGVFAGILPLCLLVVAMLPPAVRSQTVVMSATGHGDTTMSYAEVYDDGGPSGTYSPVCNASYTFHTVNPSGHYRIEVQSFLTNDASAAQLTIKKGTATGTTIATYPSGSGGIYYTPDNTVTVCFTADDDNPTQGFKVILCEFSNAIPGSVTTGFLDSTTAVINLSGFSFTATWYLEYAIVDSTFGIPLDIFFSDTSNFTRVTLTGTNSYVIPNVPIGYHIVYRIYSLPASECSPPPITGSGQPWRRPFVCPCTIPTDYTITPLQDSVTISWTTDTIVDSWHIWSYSIYLDTILPGSVTEITIPYDYPCYSGTVFINGNCDLFCNMTSFNLPMGGCQQTVGSIGCSSRTSSSIDIYWNDVEDSTVSYLLFMRCLDNRAPTFDSILDTLPFGTTAYSATGLHPHSRYRFIIQTICGNGSLGCYLSQNTYTTTLDNCIDYYDLQGNSAVHFTYGTYDNPTRSQYYNAGCHQAITDLNLYDNKTGNQLRCIPPGEEVSFKLGNASTGAQAETVTFDYIVDSTDKDMLVLKYAVVMQNPNHTSANQPHFTMEILDNYGMILDTVCCYADFAAGSELGWNSVAGTNIIWKDWTTVGIVIAKYHGQLIKIRFTTKDCADGGHFGYAYFTIHCDSKQIALVNLCETDDSVRLRAPLGFEYRWTRGEDTTVISTENEIIVPADSNIYRCYATFIGKPECSFIVSSRAVLPFPKAAFEYSIDTCDLKLRLWNRSYVDIDSVYLPYVRQTVGDIMWIVDGDTLRGDSLSLDIRSDTTYTVTLFCTLSESFCVDSASETFNLHIYHSQTITGSTTACNGDTVSLVTQSFPPADVDFHWSDLSTDTARSFAVSADTTICVIYSYKSCTDTVCHNIRVFETNNDTIHAEVCQGWLDALGFYADSTGIFSLFLTNRFGCDSLSVLNLLVHPSYYDTLSFVSCDEPFANNEFEEDSTGFYTHSYVSQYGCDSICCLDFYRHKLFFDTITAEILHGDTYEQNHFSESETGVYQNIYTDIFGCDSIYTLDLNVVRLLFPNAVTPNGDGYNDILEIVGLIGSTIFDTPKIYVYNRWGNIIYRCDNIRSRSDFWNPNETNSPAGTYFYRFTVYTKGHMIEHNSTVEVIRTP